MPENLASLIKAFQGTGDDQRTPTGMKDVGGGINQFTGAQSSPLDPYSKTGKMLQSLNLINQLGNADAEAEKLRGDVSKQKGSALLETFETVPRLFMQNPAMADAYVKQRIGKEAGVRLRVDPKTNQAIGGLLDIPGASGPIAFGAKGVLSPQETLTQSTGMAKDFYQMNKLFIDKRNELITLKTNLIGAQNAVQNNMSPRPQDMAVLISFIKALTPGIVTKEEFERARSADPLLDRAFNDLAALKDGKMGFLTPESRQSYLLWVQQNEGALNQQINNSLEQWLKAGSAYGLDRGIVESVLSTQKTSHWLDGQGFSGMVPQQMPGQGRQRVAPNGKPVKRSEDFKDLMKQNLFRKAPKP